MKFLTLKLFITLAFLAIFSTTSFAQRTSSQGCLKSGNGSDNLPIPHYLINWSYNDNIKNIKITFINSPQHSQKFLGIVITNKNNPNETYNFPLLQTGTSTSMVGSHRNKNFNINSSTDDQNSTVNFDLVNTVLNNNNLYVCTLRFVQYPSLAFIF